MTFTKEYATLTDECANLVGERLRVEPINGWGWEKFDESTNRYISFNFSDVPQPFSIKYMKVAYEDATPRGGIAEILEEGHPFSGLFFVFLAWTDDAQDFRRPNNSYHVYFLDDCPSIIPKIGTRTRSWIINKQAIKFSGYARVCRQLA
jgi:hypothetical protein